MRRRRGSTRWSWRELLVGDAGPLTTRCDGAEGPGIGRRAEPLVGDPGPVAHAVRWCQGPQASASAWRCWSATSGGWLASTRGAAGRRRRTGGSRGATAPRGPGVGATRSRPASTNVIGDGTVPHRRSEPTTRLTQPTRPRGRRRCRERRCGRPGRRASAGARDGPTGSSVGAADASTSRGDGCQWAHATGRWGVRWRGIGRPGRRVSHRHPPAVASPGLPEPLAWPALAR